jgi:hypothetical protein
MLAHHRATIPAFGTQSADANRLPRLRRLLRSAADLAQARPSGSLCALRPRMGTDADTTGAGPSEGGSVDYADGTRAHRASTAQASCLPTPPRATEAPPRCRAASRMGGKPNTAYGSRRSGLHQTDRRHADLAAEHTVVYGSGTDERSLGAGTAEGSDRGNTDCANYGARVARNVIRARLVGDGSQVTGDRGVPAWGCRNARHNQNARRRPGKRLRETQPWD